jgi:hypothetical protein
MRPVVPVPVARDDASEDTGSPGPEVADEAEERISETLAS